MEKQNYQQTPKRGGWKLSEETKKRIAKARLGIKFSEETKQKMRDSWTEEKRLEFSKKLSGENNYFFGKKFTEEHKAKIKATWTLEKREYFRQLKLGKKLPLGKGNRKGYNPINTPHPTCSIEECKNKIRFDNTIGVCRKHRSNSPIFREQKKKEYWEDVENRRKRNRDCASKRKDKKQEYDMVYREKNGKKIDNRIKEWRKKRIKIDPLFKLKIILQARIGSIFRKSEYKKKNRTMELVGCDLKSLKIYLEKQFKDGMIWENHGKWHIDHIIPLASAETESEMIKLCHYTNLQPLWALDNLRKGKKIYQRSL